MNELKITTAEVRNCAQQLRRLNVSLDDVLTRAKTEMRALSGVWQSDGSETIRQRFEQFSQKFVEEKETIEEYARFLDLTAESYDSLESTITDNASTFN